MIYYPLASGMIICWIVGAVLWFNENGRDGWFFGGLALVWVSTLTLTLASLLKFAA
jgi:hypothetical protein